MSDFLKWAIFMGLKRFIKPQSKIACLHPFESWNLENPSMWIALQKIPVSIEAKRISLAPRLEKSLNVNGPLETVLNVDLQLGCSAATTLSPQTRFFHFDTKWPCQTIYPGYVPLPTSHTRLPYKFCFPHIIQSPILHSGVHYKIHSTSEVTQHVNILSSAALLQFIFYLVAISDSNENLFSLQGISSLRSRTTSHSWRMRGCCLT